MLFNSYVFIFCYLPITLIGFFWLGKTSHRLAALWLAGASLFLRLVGRALCGAAGGSITFNYGAGYLIGRGLTGERCAIISAQHKAHSVFTTKILKGM